MYGSGALSLRGSWLESEMRGSCFPDSPGNDTPEWTRPRRDGGSFLRQPARGQWGPEFYMRSSRRFGAEQVRQVLAPRHVITLRRWRPVHGGVRSATGCPPPRGTARHEEAAEGRGQHPMKTL